MQGRVTKALMRVMPVAMIIAGGSVCAPAAQADNSRLNKSVFANIYTAQRQNGCSTEARVDDRLIEAARRHTLDLLGHSDVNGEIGSDGSNVADRARAANYSGKVSETVAIN